MADQLVQSCDVVEAGLCVGNLTWEPVYLLPPDSSTQLSLLLAGGFDVQTAELGFLGVITLFVAGLSVGFIINMIRKLR